MFLIIFLLVISTGAEENSVFGKLKSGFQFAGKLLGIDQAKGVAQLVSETFGKTFKKGDGANGSNIFSGFLRLLGFDSKRVGAVAVNAIIFVAQLISSSLTKTTIPQVTQARTLREGTPLDWMMSSSEVINMFTHIRDKDLPNHIIMHIKERTLDEDTDCVQLLICKASPFIWEMQKILDGNNSVAGPKVLFAFLPTMDNVITNADKCDKKHPYCFIHI